MKKTIITMGAAFLACSFSAQASILAVYDFTNNDLTSGDAETNTTASAIDTGSGLNTIIDTSANSLQGFGLGGTSTSFGFTTLNDSIATAITNNDFITFNLDVVDNFSADFTTLTFSLQAGNQGVRSANQFAVFSSIDGFTDGNQIATGGNPIGSRVEHTVDLSSLTGVTGDTEFRIFVFGAGGDGAAGGSATVFDNITLNGDIIAVPEPSSTALLGLGGLALLARRRK